MHFCTWNGRVHAIRYPLRAGVGWSYCGQLLVVTPNQSTGLLVTRPQTCLMCMAQDA